MLVHALLAMVAAAFASPKVNDYVLVKGIKGCPASSRIPLPCGNCGPGWGDLSACEDQCNARDNCDYITFFDDNGCRIYTSCGQLLRSEADHLGVDTQVYHRTNPKPVPIPPAKVTVHAGQTTHKVNPLYMGCHSDTGYVHQARGFSSQLLFGESFEAAPGEAHTWQATIHESTANATVELLTGDGLHGQTALHVHYKSGHGLAALANRGLHNEGLFLQKGKTYEGFLWIKSADAGAVTVSLFDYTKAPPPPAPSGNVYTKVSHGQACEEASRIPLPCGSCGPHWGDVTKCESTCNQLDDCRFITFFEDLGCRVYTKCDAPAPYGPVGTDIYHRTDPTPVPPTPPGELLATTSVQHGGGNNWTKVSFELTPSADTPCEGITPGSDSDVDCGRMGPGPGHICVRCGGQLAVGLSAPGEVMVDFVWLQPGEWGRLGSLPVLKDTIETLQSIGVKAIRQGGSFTDPEYYFWKNWRGPMEQRPSVGATWGHELISSFGPFEMIDMCVAAGFEPIITTTGQSGSCCAPKDMADLVEYCWGNASTTWGAQRIADDHPEPYPLRFIELGNEQYNSAYVDQVAAMEERAKAVGKGGELYYISPNNNQWLHPDDAARAEGLGLRDHLLEDFHVGGGGAVDIAINMFKANTTEGMINLETNAGTHEMGRALSEAVDLNAFFNQFVTPTSGDAIGRIKGRTASFCTERSGHYDAFDQGITFFLPNMSFIQPPGYVHKMVHDSWMPDALAVEVTSGTQVSASAQSTGSQLRVMLTNSGNQVANVTVMLQGVTTLSPAHVTTLSASDLGAANTPGQPTLVSPVTHVVSQPSDGVWHLPMYSFTIIVFDKK